MRFFRDIFERLDLVCQPLHRDGSMIFVVGTNVKVGFWGIILGSPSLRDQHVFAPILSGRNDRYFERKHQSRR